jgi:hydroxymethylbilane synthase
VPIGVNTKIENGQLTLTGMVSSLDGKRFVKDTVSGAAETAELLGIDLAHRLRQQGASEILEEIFAQVQRGS